MKTNFHNKNFALRLALKMRQARTLKWPILLFGFPSALYLFFKVSQAFIDLVEKKRYFRCLPFSITALERDRN